MNLKLRASWSKGRARVLRAYHFSLSMIRELANDTNSEIIVSWRAEKDNFQWTDTLK